MKISRNWLNNYIKSKKSDIELVDAFTQLGLECTSTKINSIDSNIIIGEIVSCVKHPNADRLKVCEVDVSNNELLTIVCGAPNVTDKILVPVAKIGSKIGSFKIKKTKIRDIVSHGMICSEKELGLSDNHEGVMILDDNLSKGEKLTTALSLETDTIFDFDITPNRGDCFSHLGIARELAIIEDSKLELDQINFKSAKFNTSDLIKLNIANSDLCPRYSCRVIKNIKVQESPEWLKKQLVLIGHKSINNIVDLANYIMFDTGQPLHAFDYDKLNGDKIEVRTAKNNEKILCLNNELNKLNKDDIVIADSKGPIAIAGVIGGFDSQVDEKTTNILLESAIFNEVSVRKTSKKYDYEKEASKRFERGIDYHNVIYAMDKFTKFILDITDGESSSNFVDVQAKKNQDKKIEFNFNECNNFLGLDLNSNDYKNIFSKLSIDVINKKDIFICKIPSYRNDLYREIDLYEEVARVFGYDNIPISKTFNNSYSAIIDNSKDINNQIRLILCSKGFYEHYSNSLYNDKVLKDFNIFETPEIINESSQDMKYMRNSLMPGLLKAVSFNEKRDQDNFKLFEIGRIHSIIKSYNKEEDSMGFVWYGKNNQHWNSKFIVDIFHAKGELLSILKQLKVSDIHFKVEESKLSETNINIYSKKAYIGYLRLLDSKLKEKYDIKGPIVVSEICIDKISKNIIKDFQYKKTSPFPSVKRDISILLKNELDASDIIECIYNSSDKLLIDTNVFDVYSGKELGKDSKSLAISLTFQSKEKTLVDKDVDDRVLSILDKLKTKFGIVQR